MIAILLTILAGVPADQPGYKPQRPRVVIVTLRNCTPCEEVKAALKPLMDDSAVDVIVEDLYAWNRRTADGFNVYTAPTVFAWHDPKMPGRRLEYRRRSPITLKRVREALKRRANQTPPRRPLSSSLRSTGTGASRLPWLSINGIPAKAVHHVTISGPIATVSPNTESAWRRHVGDDHGIKNAGRMTPKQLAQAHSAAHFRRGR